MPLKADKSIPFTPPMECLPVERLPEGDDWTYELKLDGYRAQGIRDARGARILSKNGKDLSKKFPAVMAAINDALMEQTAVDGELVAFDEDGRPSFNVMQNAGPDDHVVFFAFDILADRGRDVNMRIGPNPCLLSGVGESWCILLSLQLWHDAPQLQGRSGTVSHFVETTGVSPDVALLGQSVGLEKDANSPPALAGPLRASSGSLNSAIYFMIGDGWNVAVSATRAIAAAH